MPNNHGLQLTSTLSDVGKRLPELTQTLERYSARIVVKDTEGHFLALNQAALADLGFDDAEQISQCTDANFYSQKYAQSSRDIELAVQESLSPSLNEVEFQRLLRNNRQRVVLMSRFPRIQNDLSAGIVSVSRELQ